MPFHSARIELRREGYPDNSRQAAALTSMVQNLWEPVIKKQTDKLRIIKMEAESSMFSGLAGKRASGGTSSANGSSSSHSNGKNCNGVSEGNSNVITVNCSDFTVAVRYPWLLVIPKIF